MRFWIGHGVRIFRVDNPHTKAFPFWEWLIAEIRREHPDVVMLAEAFVRPAVMQRLAKIGFSQSYTYFTWRNTAWELGQYLTELSQTELVDWFRPNFWVNTPDILHATLQHGGPARLRTARRAGRDHVPFLGDVQRVRARARARRCARGARSTWTPRSTSCDHATGRNPGRSHP